MKTLKTRKNQRGGLVSRTQLAAMLGRSSSTVARWQYDGCPFVAVEIKAGGVRKVPFYDVEKVKRWLLQKYNFGK